MGDQTHFDTALRFMSNGLILVDPDHRIGLFNDRLLALFGLPAGELAIGMPLERFLRNIAPRLGWDEARTRNVIANHDIWMASDAPTVLEHHFDDGGVMRISCNPLPAGGAVITYDDVTTLRHATAERERMEAEARRAERQLALLVSGITDYAIYLVAPDGTILNWNTGAERMKGYTAHEVVGRNFAMFWGAEEQRRGGPRDALATARLSGRFEIEGLRYRKDGSSFWAHVLISPLFETDGSLLGFAKITRDMTEQKEASEKIEHMVGHDVLTGLPNRMRFIEELDAALSGAAAAGTKVAIVNFDLDGFKSINDTHGHATGDHVLRNIAARITGELAPGEIVARFGGDEFVGLKPYDDAADLDGFLSRMRMALMRPIDFMHGKITTGASFGVASFPLDAENGDKLLDNADLAMYRSKAAIGDKICFFNKTMDETARGRRALAADLWKAVERGEFHLEYQCQCDAASGATAGFEALLRWRHPVYGPISPADFIPVAEECGAIIPIGEWVLRRACNDAVEFGLERLAVNLSAVQLGRPALVGEIAAILRDSGLAPEKLELEVTETAVIADRNQALHILNQLKAFGIGIVLDDFGTGYSSLHTLRTFPFDRIKLDRSFAKGIESDPRARAFVVAMMTLGRSLELSVLAEGVETDGQLSILSSVGLDEVQGFLLGRPGELARHQPPPAPAPPRLAQNA